MKIISIGDLVLDYYYKNDKLIGVNGGMTSHNIIANLSKYKHDLKVISVCGNDIEGDTAIKSLKDLKIDVSDIKRIDNIRTRCFHVSYKEENNKLSFTSKKRCPICNNKKWYEESLINSKEVIKSLNKEDILVFDNLNKINQAIIDNTGNKKFIDLGQYFEFENLKDQEIISKIKNKFTIINFNERVANYFIKRFNLKDELDLYNLFNPLLITLTHGDKGAVFIYNNKLYNFKLENKSENVVDSTGAGDAFCASIIHSYIKNNLNIEPDKFKKWYEDSTKITYKVVTKMGARGHLKSLYKIKPIKDFCTCDNFELQERKKIKRCNININNLNIRILNALNSNAFKELEKINFNENENYIFLGTGGSFVSSYFASLVINKLYSANTYSMYPRNFIYRNNNKIDKVFLFSYSGTTNDLLEATKNFNKNNICIITKGNSQNIVIKTGISKKNIISYRTNSNRSSERGFLSFEGATAPSSIFLKYYIEKESLNIDIEKFITDSINYWFTYFEKSFKEEKIINMFKNNLINIFTGDYTNCASIDLESKLIESGVINCLVHEKKNFSHGRFINYENLNNKNSIYFMQKDISKYEYKLLDYLNKDNCFIIQSRYNGLLAEYDLLLSSQILVYYIGKVLDIDISKPTYSEDAMKIYFYKGDL